MENDYILIKICETHPGGILRVFLRFGLFHPDILIETILIKKACKRKGFADTNFKGYIARKEQLLFKDRQCT